MSVEPAPFPITAMKMSRTTNLVLFTILSFLNFVIVYNRYHSFKQLQTVETYSYVGNDFPDLLPLNRPLTYIDHRFTNSTHEYPIHGPDALDAWNRVYPSGFGFVRLGPERRILCVSMFHQLHCIEKMRKALDNPDDPIATIPHLQHCMNYIRQTILCGADTTLEPVGSEGIGVSHTCRDWNVVYETIEDNYERWTDYWETVKDSVPNS